MYDIATARFVPDSELDRCFAFVAITSRRASQIDAVEVDTTSLTVTPKGEMLRARSIAPIAPTSKIELSLRSRMAAMNETDAVAVVLWFQAEAGMDANGLQQRAYEELVRTIPEAAENLARTGKPIGVDDSEVSRRIFREYSRIVAEAPMPELLRTTAAMLSSRGIEVSVIPPMPAIRTRLTKRLIADLAEQTGISAIYLAEGTPVPMLGDSARSQGLDKLWSSGLVGDGKKIAIIELENVQRSNTYLTFDPYYFPSPIGEGDHATHVAAAAASTHPEMPGSARGASILSVGVSTDPWDSIWGFHLASDAPHNARFVNYSVCWQTDGHPNVVARGFDFYARLHSVFAVASAGNSSSSFVCSPAESYNILGVGGFDNKNTPSWEDDDMYPSSSWINPISTHHDREKPELVASAMTITAWGLNNAVVVGSGTSLASPYVAGVAALLTVANPNLLAWPEATRAILMASAIHNIEGAPRITPSVDIRDGAGALAADQALEAALHLGDSVSPCQTSCWWYQTLNDPQPTTDVYRSFAAKQGERIRIAISWWSTVSPYPFDKDYLDLDIDIFVTDPYGYSVSDGSSTSYDNNYELVDFVAPMTGIYTLRARSIRIPSTAIPTNYLGIALVKPTYRTYVPMILR